MKNVWISGGVILGICTFVSSLFGLFDIRLIISTAIVVLYIAAITIIYKKYWDEDKAIAFTGMTLIIISCIMSGLIIGMIDNNGLKYALIFGIGTYVVFTWII